MFLVPSVDSSDTLFRQEQRASQQRKPKKAKESQNPMMTVQLFSRTVSAPIDSPLMLLFANLHSGKQL